ncbi:DedA family protein [Cohnella nanjingensis]|uniref:DedA family protein n=1 Tax=Cohnella nanjingensis TaxID=1387779 RepID=A0A7X0RPQ5_9BACL|nr:hypothetical protein [Cohnella nanjingensis]MBB6671188.1 hypothetical protein [Cohnella nanjingensis]
MVQRITELMDAYGFMGILLLIALEYLFPPISSGVNAMAVIIVSSTLGVRLGAILLYGAGRLLNMERLERIVERNGRILRLTPKDTLKANDWFAKYGAWTVLFCRLVPLLWSLNSIPTFASRKRLLAGK